MELELLIQRFIIFSRTTFEKATVRSSLEKCKDEIKEIEQLLNGDDEFPDYVLIDEYIDCIMCLIDSASRAGFTSEEIKASFSRKLLTNQRRTWRLNSNNTYSHIKS